MLTIKKINKEKVKCIPKPKIDKKNIRGYDLFPELHSNIFLLAKKHSGKTVVLFNILKKSIGRDTRVIIFSTTAYKDHNMLHIRKYLKKKNINHEIHQSLYDGKLNILQQIIDDLKEKAKLAEEAAEEADDEDEPKQRFISVDSDDDSDKPRKRRKEKYISPEVIIVFDDMSTELRNPMLTTLLKTHRHYNSKIILSSQWLHDLQPSGLTNLDYMLVFKGLPDAKLELVYDSFDISIDFKKFKQIYDHATAEPYSFLWVSRDGNFRRNFDCLYTIKN